MGYMRHHAIIVTSYDKHIKEARERAEEIFGIGIEIIYSQMNGYGSFFIPPDGSKEGWNESDEGDVRRKDFIKWLKSQKYSDGSSSIDWVEIQYGDDEGETKIISHSDEI